jgi:hypothetical protein
VHIENALKGHPVFTERLRALTILNKKYVELLQIDGLALPEVDKLFREIIAQVEYSPDNYAKLLEENKALKKQLAEREATTHLQALRLVQIDHARLQGENAQLIRKYNTLQKRSHTLALDGALAPDCTSLPPPAPVEPGHVRAAFKKHMKNKEGVYTIDGQTYAKNEGTRQEVWDGCAYQTSGLLRKHDLVLNTHGKLVSKKKCLSAATQNHLDAYNASR